MRRPQMTTNSVARRLAKLEQRHGTKPSTAGALFLEWYDRPAFELDGLPMMGTAVWSDLIRQRAAADPQMLTRFASEGDPARWPEFMLHDNTWNEQVGGVRPWKSFSLEQKRVYQGYQMCWTNWQRDPSSVPTADAIHPDVAALTLEEIEAIVADYDAWRKEWLNARE
jgi:hypothetical protein